jgi:hypothetical protein
MEAFGIVYPFLKNKLISIALPSSPKFWGNSSKVFQIPMLILSRFSSPSPSAKGSTSNAHRSNRWGLLAKPTLGVALAMGVLTAGQAQAMVVNLGGQDWEVIPFTVSYSNNLDEMTSIPLIPPEPPLPECIGPGARRVWMTAITGDPPNESITHH